MRNFLKMIVDKRKPGQTKGHRPGTYRAGNAEAISEPDVGNLLVFRNLRRQRDNRSRDGRSSMEIFALFESALGRNPPWHGKDGSDAQSCPGEILDVPRQSLTERHDRPSSFSKHLMRMILPPYDWPYDRIVNDCSPGNDKTASAVPIVPRYVSTAPGTQQLPDPVSLCEWI